MKKFLNLFFVLLIVVAGITKSNAVTFDEAYSQCGTKPMLMLVYAQWADNYQGYIQQFKNIQNEFGDQFNYVEMDIANPQTKSFNSKYHIYPNLPYVLMYRKGGQISRYIQRDCAANSECMIPKVKSFIQ